MTAPATVPTSNIDLFTDEVLTDPYPAYQALRDAGPVSYLDRYDMFVFSRYEQVRTVLSDWETFSSAQGVGMNDILNAAWNGTIIASDPPHHTNLRNVLSERLSPRSLRALSGDIKERIDHHVDSVVARGSFDAVTDLARVVPISCVLDLLGFPEKGRDQLLEWAVSCFNAVGPDNPRMQASLPKMQEMFEWLMSTCVPDQMIPGGFATTIHEAARRGDIAPEVVVPLMAGYSIPALDTTISALGSSIQLFADNPDQWDAVRADPSLIPGAFNEVLRLESPVQLFCRVVTADCDVEGVPLPAGARVIVLYGAANRDERQYPDPQRFDVHRNPVDHLAFGYSLHGCPGQGLARIEAHAVLESLARRVTRFEITGAPSRELGNTTRSLSGLPVRVHTAADHSIS